MRGAALGALLVVLVAAALAMAALMGEEGEEVPGEEHPYFLTWCAAAADGRLARPCELTHDRKTTGRPPLSYEDVDSDDGDARAGAAAQRRPMGVQEVLGLLQEGAA